MPAGVDKNGPRRDCAPQDSDLRGGRRATARLLEYYRDLIMLLLAAEIKVRYRSTALGYVWSVLHPLMFTLVFLFAFKVVLKIQIENYTLFLIAGLFPWQAIQNSVCSGSNVFLGNTSLIKRVCFRRHLLVVVSVLNDLVHYCFSLPIIAIMMAVYGVAPTWQMLWALPLLMLTQFFITLGLSLFVATCNLFMRDLERLVIICMMLWFYVTPILYKEAWIPEQWRWVNYANPLAALIINWRRLFLGMPVEPYGLAVSAAWAIALFAVGYGTYRKLNWRFGELV